MPYKTNRTRGFIIITFVYLAAAAAGIAVFFAFPALDAFYRILAADVAATLAVWLAGVLLGNSSVYDPYWSVAPMIIIPLAAVYYGLIHAGSLLLLLAVLPWGVRLTLNWARSFRSLDEQDWRYDKLRREHPRLWPIVNLAGIHLVPTLAVYGGLIPGIRYLTDFRSVNAWSLLSLTLCLLATLLESAADRQMRRFRRTPGNRRKPMREGLWRYSRHPNYLGEILFWWGVYFLMLSSGFTGWRWIAGPLGVTMLFVFISVPLMETRLMESKDGYREYSAQTGMLFPNFLKGTRRMLD